MSERRSSSRQGGQPEQRLHTGEVVARIQAARPGLIPSEQKVADLILADPTGVLRSSVSDVADRARTSESTVVRACQHIGFKGFHDVKLALAHDLAIHDDGETELTRSRDLGTSTPRTEIPALILRESAAALHDAIGTLDVQAFDAAVGAVSDAGRVLVLGNGTSSAPAQDVAYRLSTIGLVVAAPPDAFGQHLAVHTLTERDCVIAVSHSGATRETLTPAETARRCGARIVAVTSFTRSPLTALADHSLVVGGPEMGFRQEAMTSRLAHLAILDALFVGVALSQPKRSRDFLEIMADVTAEHTL